MTVLPEGSRSRVYYVYDVDSGENILRRDNMNEAFNEASKLNKSEKNYKVKGAWVLIKNKGE